MVNLTLCKKHHTDAVFLALPCPSLARNTSWKSRHQDGRGVRIDEAPTGQGDQECLGPRGAYKMQSIVISLAFLFPVQAPVYAPLLEADFMYARMESISMPKSSPGYAQAEADYEKRCNQGIVIPGTAAAPDRNV